MLTGLAGTVAAQLERLLPVVQAIGAAFAQEGIETRLHLAGKRLQSLDLAKTPALERGQGQTQDPGRTRVGRADNALITQHHHPGSRLT
jgi:hypothetical protein